jgi:hypothetical protein
MKIPPFFNPNSTDSKLAEVLTRLDGQDVVLNRILVQSVKTNGRVGSLEAFRAAALVLGSIGMLILGAVASAVAMHYLG